MPDLLKQILALDSIEALSAHLTSLPKRSTQKSLLKAFDARIEYEDAHQWAEAVRLCEALAIVGWGDRERVDAICERCENQWTTYFVTANDERRYREGHWVKRKAGFVLFNPEYHFSPDKPDKPAVGWMKFAGIDFPCVAIDKLPSQRNRQQRMPITFGGVGGDNATSRAVWKLERELSDCLRRTLRLDHYGDAVETFNLGLFTPYPGVNDKPHREPGRYAAKSRTYRSILHFDENFHTLAPIDQRAYLGENLLAAIDDLAAKLRKARITYDIAAFRDDVEKALSIWGKSKPTKPLARK
jgi:hypothetical protein